MHLIMLKNAFNNLTLKIISCIIGCGIWFMLSQSHAITTQIQVPVCFYNRTSSITIESPESVTVCLLGKRSDLYALDKNNLAVHIDATTLKEGENLLPVHAELLFLPSRIKLLNYSPLNNIITVTMHTQEQSNDNQMHA